MPATPWWDADTLFARRLRPGPGIPREVVAADQRERSMGALVVLADDRDYPSLRVEDLIALAGVSRGAWVASYRPPPAALRRPRGDTAGADARVAPRDQAERILLGLCDAVYDKGYAATTLADVAARASTLIRTFYAHYKSKEQAFVDAVDLAQVQSEAAMLAASRRALDWPHAVRAGLGALCGYLAVAPVTTYLALSPFVGPDTACEVANASGQPRRRA
jgi:AcrR family transcriptional regulator